MTSNLQLLVCSTVLLTQAVAVAQAPVNAMPFQHPDGTTHWYEPVVVTGGIDWPTAHAAAATAGGYLATITSGQENTFVFGLVDKPEFFVRNQFVGEDDGPWLGGVQPPNSTEPTGGWIWGELEPITYTNWRPTQPDNKSAADRIHFGGDTQSRVATWSDSPATKKLAGYVIEYSGATSPLTVGLQRRDPGSLDGYTLLAPRQSRETYLLDPRGRPVHRWSSAYLAGLPAYLLPNGNLIRAGQYRPTSFPGAGVGGTIEEFDWAGKVVWQFTHSTQAYCLHHDFIPMPNGNLLLIAWELKTKAEAIQAGRNPNLLPDNELWPDKIIEVKPLPTGGGTIVWEWHAWDHLIQDYDSTKSNYGKVEQHPELIDINYTRMGNNDWLHVNSVAYNPKLDQIVISTPPIGEIWIIDHSTTTAQAASHSGGRSGKGGDLLYRWGNPEAYRAGTRNDRRLFAQHDAQWIDPSLPGGGNILVFNNGRNRPGGNYSSVDELIPPTPDAKGNYPMTGKTWGPSSLTWTYVATPPESFFAPTMSSAQRLSNGNTLICEGPTGRVFEVTNTGSIVWQYTNPDDAGIPTRRGEVVGVGTEVFRALRYPPNYAGLSGKTLIPGEPIEVYDTALLADGSSADHRVKVGSTVDLSIITAAANSGRFFQVVTSATPGLIPVDYRFARLGVDPLLFLTLTNSLSTVFQGYVGQLDTTGRGAAKIAVPAIPGLAGIELHTVFVVVDQTAPSSINPISNTVVVRLEN